MAGYVCTGHTSGSRDNQTVCPAPSSLPYIHRAWRPGAFLPGQPLSSYYFSCLPSADGSSETWCQRIRLTSNLSMYDILNVFPYIRHVCLSYRIVYVSVLSRTVDIGEMSMGLE